MNESDRISLPISALQHWLFCNRQFGLIHIEQLWAENRYTAEGQILHEKVESSQSEQRGSLKILRSVELFSVEHGLHGVADVVELRDGHPYPVEYKRGKPKNHRADEVQLCAQALCLEETFKVDIPEGALFYGKRRRRTEVCLDAELRKLTLTVSAEAREVLASGLVPQAVFRPDRCGGCSLRSLCRPERLSSPPQVLPWMQRMVGSPATPE